VQAKAQKKKDGARLVSAMKDSSGLALVERAFDTQQPVDPTASQGGSGHRFGRCRQGGGRYRTAESRLRLHRCAERRQHGRAPDRSRKHHRARFRFNVDQHADVDRPSAVYSRCRPVRSMTFARPWSECRPRSSPSAAVQKKPPAFATGLGCGPIGHGACIAIRTSSPAVRRNIRPPRGCG
jgi:hypothetical protein